MDAGSGQGRDDQAASAPGPLQRTARRPADQGPPVLQCGQGTLLTARPSDQPQEDEK